MVDEELHPDTGMHRLRSLRLAGQRTRRGNWRCRSGDFRGVVRRDLLTRHWAISVCGPDLVLTASAHFTTKAQARAWAEGKIRALRTMTFTAHAGEEFTRLEARWQHIDALVEESSELLAILYEALNRPLEQPLPYILVMQYRELYRQVQQRWFLDVEQQRQYALGQLRERGCGGVEYVVTRLLHVSYACLDMNGRGAGKPCLTSVAR